MVTKIKGLLFFDDDEKEEDECRQRTHSQLSFQLLRQYNTQEASCLTPLCIYTSHHH